VKLEGVRILRSSQNETEEKEVGKVHLMIPTFIPACESCLVQPV